MSRGMLKMVSWLSIGLLAAVNVALARSLPQLFVTSDRCLACHNGLVTPDGQDVSIGTDWRASMMAHAAKDPYWQASVRRESLDHPDAAADIEDECAACHMPMARYLAKAGGQKGMVFAHLPILPAGSRAGRLAEDGVSCTMCHQIGSRNLGTADSFTAGFVVDTTSRLGERPVYGPYDVDEGRRRIMRSAAQMVPTRRSHVQRSALCGSCHTLYTHTRGADGRVIGKLPEQVPFLEWRHSAYTQSQSCQSCHMPRLEDPMAITSVLPKSRSGFSQHVFRGGNFLMPRIFNRNRSELGVTALPGELAHASRQTANHLETRSARLEIRRADATAGRLAIEVAIVNLAGHKLPTAYPSRRAWLHLTVTDRSGATVFESGALNPDGSIQGNDNDRHRDRYEPHRDRIRHPEEVQIYEAVMVDPEDNVTTGLLTAIRFKKDNRLLPRGFDKSAAQDDIAVQGAAVRDADFAGGGDAVHYTVDIARLKGPFTIRAALWYQPIGFRWAHNLARQKAPEIDRFVAYFEAISDQSGHILATDTRTTD